MYKQEKPTIQFRNTIFKILFKYYWKKGACSLFRSRNYKNILKKTIQLHNFWFLLSRFSSEHWGYLSSGEVASAGSPAISRLWISHILYDYDLKIKKLYIFLLPQILGQSEYRCEHVQLSHKEAVWIDRMIVILIIYMQLIST